MRCLRTVKPHHEIEAISVHNIIGVRFHARARIWFEEGGWLVDDIRVRIEVRHARVTRPKYRR